MQTATGLDAATVFDALVFLLVDGLCGTFVSDDTVDTGDSACDSSSATNASICRQACTAALAVPAVTNATTFDAAFRFYLRCAEIVEIAGLDRQV